MKSFKFFALAGTICCAALGTLLFMTHSRKCVRMPKTQLVLNIGEKPQEYNPHLIRDLHSGLVSIHLYEGLFRMGENGNLLPGLAKQVAFSKDGLHCRIKLRRSFWSDGTPLTAHDIVRSWRSVISPSGKRSPFASHFYFFRGVDEIDPLHPDWSKVALYAQSEDTLCFSLKHPVPHFLRLLALPVFYPVHPDGQADATITNGPFRLKKSQMGQYLLWEKNPFYWDSSSVSFQEVKCLFVKHDRVQMTLFERGDLDFIGICLLPFPQDSAETRATFQERAMASIDFIVTNTVSKLFRSQKIRQALSLALDRNYLAQSSYQHLIPAYRYLPPVLSYGTTVASLKESPSLAQQFLQRGLEEVGCTCDDFAQVRLLCHPSQASLVKAIQGQWLKNLGIRVKAKLVSFNSFCSLLENGDFDFAVSSLVSSYADPYALLEIFRDPVGLNNFSRWSPPVFRHLLNEGLALKKKERLCQIQKLEKIILSHLPVIPLFFGNRTYAMQEGLHGVLVNELFSIDFSRASWKGS
ncbi:peptide ABC transporter substrate-binding protein [Candidatus Similichlamydia laticola]|nr:peptide ABC transporter substrate-binding protein [Candidatus Similichlamydia laticola]